MKTKLLILINLAFLSSTRLNSMDQERPLINNNNNNQVVVTINEDELLQILRSPLMVMRETRNVIDSWNKCCKQTAIASTVVAITSTIILIGLRYFYAHNF